MMMMMMMIRVAFTGEHFSTATIEHFYTATFVHFYTTIDINSVADDL